MGPTHNNQNGPGNPKNGGGGRLKSPHRKVKERTMYEPSHNCPIPTEHSH